MQKLLLVALSALILHAPGEPSANPPHRFQVVGAGIVTGLEGTGDDLGRCPMTREALKSAIQRDASIGRINPKAKSVAYVGVTARFDGAILPGSFRIDPLCGASSIIGGHLTKTTLQGANAGAMGLAEGEVVSCDVKAGTTACLQQIDSRTTFSSRSR